MTAPMRPMNGFVQSPTPIYGYQVHREVVTGPFPTPPLLPEEREAERRQWPAHINIVQNWYFATPPPAATYETQVAQPPMEPLPVPRAREAQAGATPERVLRTRHDGNVPIDGVRGAQVPPAQHRGGTESFAHSPATDAGAGDANAAHPQSGTRERHEWRYHVESDPTAVHDTTSSSSATNPTRGPPSPLPTPQSPALQPATPAPSPTVASAPATAPATAHAAVSAPPPLAPIPVPVAATAAVPAPAGTTAQIPMVDIYNPTRWGPADPIWTPEHRDRGYGPYRPFGQGVSSNQAPPIAYDPDLEDARTVANTAINRRSNSRGSNGTQQGYQQARVLPTPPYEEQPAPARNAMHIAQNVHHAQAPPQPQPYVANCPHCNVPGAHNPYCPVYQQASFRHQGVPTAPPAQQPNVVPPPVAQPPIRPDRSQDASAATNNSHASQTRGVPRRPRRAVVPEDSPPPVIPPPLSPPRDRRRRRERAPEPEVPRPRREEGRRHREVAQPPPVVPPPLRERPHDIVTNAPVIPEGTYPDAAPVIPTPPPSRPPSLPQPAPAAPQVIQPQSYMPAVYPGGLPYLGYYPGGTAQGMPYIPGQRGLPMLYPHLRWAPHPQPHPTVSPATFFDLTAMPASQFDAAAVLRMNNFPLPGTMPNGWQPPAWPPARPTATPYGPAMGLPTPSSGNGATVPQTSPFGAVPLLHPNLMPNPGNTAEPWFLWDVRHPPSTARRIAPRSVVVSASDKFTETATHPAVPRIHIVYNSNTVGLLNYWGPIVIEKGEGGQVLFGDIINSVYEYLQTPLLQNEAAVIQRDFPELWGPMTRAFRKRCEAHYWIPEVEWARGMRRVDCLGDRHMWWGMWVTHNADRTFQLNLGLVPKKQNYIVQRLVSTRRR